MPEGEQLVAADEEGVGPIARKACEGCIDVAAVTGVEDLDLQTHGAGGGLDVSHCDAPAGVVSPLWTGVILVGANPMRRALRRE